MTFKSNDKFDTEKKFREEFPIFANAKIVLNPFTITNTDGACILFKTPDGSHFIWTLSTNTCTILGASEGLQKNFSIGWIFKNILNLTCPYTQIKQDEKYTFVYDSKRYSICLSKLNDINYSGVMIFRIA